jgi:hypothetical protein
MKQETVVTHMTFNAGADAAWNTMVFYEQIDARPSFFLRLLLPVPIRTEGRKSVVGDEALCVYEGGHLIKRVTAVNRSRHLAFDVTKQELNIGLGMKLSGGWYDLQPLPDGRTDVALATVFQSPRQPRWLFGQIETTVCHIFHRHILRAMRRVVERPRAATTGASVMS